MSMKHLNVILNRAPPLDSSRCECAAPLAGKAAFVEVVKGVCKGLTRIFMSGSTFVSFILRTFISLCVRGLGNNARCVQWKNHVTS